MKTQALQALGELLEVEPSALHLTPSPTGKHNTTYFVSTGRDDYVLQVAPPHDRSRMLFYEYKMMRQEPEIHRILLDQTDAPVAPVIHFQEDCPILERDWLLQKRLPGEPLSEVNGVLDAAGIQALLGDLGEVMAGVHRITSGRHGYLGAHSPMKPEDDWVSAFHVMWNKLLDDIEGCGGYSEEETSRMRKLLDHNLEHFEERRNVPASLLHMDVWAQNILTSMDGDLTGLVDWDRALWGDPEIEFAVLDYCGVSKAPFWDGYGDPPPNDRAYKVRHTFYMLYEVQKYIVIARQRRNDPQRADSYRAHSLQLATSLG